MRVRNMSVCQFLSSPPTEKRDLQLPKFIKYTCNRIIEKGSCLGVKKKLPGTIYKRIMGLQKSSEGFCLPSLSQIWSKLKLDWWLPWMIFIQIPIHKKSLKNECFFSYHNQFALTLYVYEKRHIFSINFL